jgi:nucleoid DNA-binding protein
VGRNPQTGEEVDVPAKPASVRISLRALKPLKDNAPSVQKLKRRLAA